MAALTACGRGVPPPTVEGLAAVRGPRPVEPRLTGFAYAPCQPAARAERGKLIAKPRCAPLPEGSPADLALLGNRILDAADREATAETLHAAGLLHLTLPPSRLRQDSLDRAVQSLTAAAARAPQNAPIASDLAAAYLVRGQQRDHPVDLILALAKADHAFELDPELPAARFNRALILELLFLRSAATDAWKACLDIGPGRGWDEEARDRLEALKRPADSELWPAERSSLEAAADAGDQETVRQIVERFRQPARLYGEEELLPAWAQATLKDRPAEALIALGHAEAVGEALSALGGDQMLSEAVGAIHAAAGEGDVLRRLAKGHEALAAGLPHVRRADALQARPFFAAASEQLAGSPFSAWANFYLRVCDFYQLDPERSFAAIEALRASLDPARYPILVGRTLYLSGLVPGRQRDFEAAERRFVSALEIFESQQEAENAAYVHFLLAETFDGLGAPDLAWRHRYQALAGRGQMRSPQRAHNVLYDASKAILRLGEPRAALYFQQPMVALAERLDNPVVTVEAYRSRARTHQRLGQSDKALEDLEAARRNARRVGGEVGRRVEADIQRTDAFLRAAEDPRQAAAHFTAAIDRYEATDFRIHLPDLYLGRARARLAAGNWQDAERDLLAGIAEYEASRGVVQSTELKISQFELSRSLFDELVRLRLEHGARVELAFEAAERARSRVLFDLLAGARSPEPPRLAEVRRRLPAKAALVAYSLLPEELVVWVVRRDAVELRTEAVSAGVFGRLLGDLELQLVSGEAGLDATLSQLYELLVAPVEDLVAEAETLVFLPDKEIHAVPFAALRDGAAGPFLVERVAVAVAPSATVWAGALERARARAVPGPPRSLLAVGDPRFDRARFPLLDPLAGAGSEVAAIARLYDRSRTVLGAEATAARLLAELRGADVIHLAAHAEVDSQYPTLSRLVLAGNDTLTAGELYRQEFGSTRLVVLSACRTARGPITATEGVESLARPFLAAGVPAVVASLWDVDDGATAELMIAFHRHLRSDLIGPAALRAAQIGLLRSDDDSLRSAAAWGAFQWIGSWSPQLPAAERGKT